MYDPATARVSLIDFEYAQCNFAAFDLANHLFEYAGSGPIRWELLPSEAEERSFLHGYAISAGLPTDDAALRTLHAEVRTFYAASHLFWGLWALVRSADAEAAEEFDFYGYAEERLRLVFAPSPAQGAEGRVHRVARVASAAN